MEPTRFSELQVKFEHYYSTEWAEEVNTVFSTEDDDVPTNRYYHCSPDTEKKYEGSLKKL
jgi:hypothetical protein